MKRVYQKGISIGCIKRVCVPAIEEASDDDGCTASNCDCDCACVWSLSLSCGKR